MLPSLHPLRAPGKSSPATRPIVLTLVLCSVGSAFAAPTPAPSPAPYRAAVRDVFQLFSLPPDAPSAPAPAPVPALQRLAAYDKAGRLLLLGTASAAPTATSTPGAATAPAAPAAPGGAATSSKGSPPLKASGPASAAPPPSSAAPAAQKPAPASAKASAEPPVSFVSFGYDAAGRLIEVAQRADPVAAPSRRLSRRYGTDGLLGRVAIEEEGALAYLLELSFEGGGDRARAVLTDPAGLALAAALVELGAGAAEGAPTRIAALAESGEETAVASFSYDAAGRLVRADFIKPAAAAPPTEVAAAAATAATAAAASTAASTAAGPAAAGPPDIALLLAPFLPGTGPAGAGPAALAPRAGGYAPPAAPRPEESTPPDYPAEGSVEFGYDADGRVVRYSFTGPDGLELAVLERRYDSRGLLAEEFRRGLEPRGASAPAAAPAANPARGQAGTAAPGTKTAAPGSRPASPAPAATKAAPAEFRYRFRYQSGALAGRWERSVLVVSDAFGGELLEIVTNERSLYGGKLP